MPFETDLYRAIDALAKEVKREIGHLYSSYPSGVYVVELSLPVPADSPGYVYVGQTYLTPEERFAQHKAGYKASSHVRKYGVRLRPDLYQHVPRVNTKDEALDLEERLTALLRNFGFSVKGGH